MKILFAAAEIAPLTKVGGLADVIRSLPKELIRAGHDVRVIIPHYGFLDLGNYKMQMITPRFLTLSLQEYHKTQVSVIYVEDIPVYLLNSDVISRTPEVYGKDEIGKFFIFCQSVCEVIARLGWQPDILHCHDWHTSLIPMFLREKGVPCGTLLTIHNLRYQGNFDEPFLYRTGLQEVWRASAASLSKLPLNFLSVGILWSDLINTVSKRFAKEILTPEFGWGMDPLLNIRRESLYGIINGLGHEEYDPGTDALIAATYDANDIRNKRVNKRELQSLCGFKADPSVPIIGMVSRMDEQKGLGIILRAVRDLLIDSNVQFVFLGRGRVEYEEALMALEARYPENVRAFITYDNRKAHLIFAGSDMFLMPSLYEPCGLSQLIAMRYGTVPIVRNTGGLADTVMELAEDLSTGYGFMVNAFDHVELLAVMRKAVEAYSQKSAWNEVVRRIMALDFSWKEPARRYESLYRKILKYYDGT